MLICGATYRTGWSSCPQARPSFVVHWQEHRYRCPLRPISIMPICKLSCEVLKHMLAQVQLFWYNQATQAAQRAWFSDICGCMPPWDPFKCIFHQVQVRWDNQATLAAQRTCFLDRLVCRPFCERHKCMIAQVQVRWVHQATQAAPRARWSDSFVWHALGQVWVSLAMRPQAHIYEACFS
jgi:hypothetical protein